jgi:alpha-tubulin suppressor-like RCC1 family protein
MGLRHTAIVTENHDLYTCGANNKKQLGLINPMNVSVFTKGMTNYLFLFYKNYEKIKQFL